MQDADLDRLPAEILSIIHSRVLQADPALRSCLALEATCKHLRSTLLSNTRFERVSVKAGQLATPQGSDSFWRWIAAHGRRTDLLRLHNLELHHSTPRLCSHPGVLQARVVAVSAVLIDTLEPLRGLLNLAVVEYSSALNHPDGGVSLEPLADLPALEHVDLGDATSTITCLALLRRMAALTSLKLRNFQVPQLDQLGSLCVD
jgi:hypothetical protein